MVMISTHTYNASSLANLLIAILVGLGVGLIEDIPIELIPVGFAGAS